MGGVGQQAGRPVQATDVIPKWDHAVELLGDRAIIVYPQATGETGTGDAATEGEGQKFRQVGGGGAEWGQSGPRAGPRAAAERARAAGRCAARRRPRGAWLPRPRGAPL
jgi:hypothetical protein